MTSAIRSCKQARKQEKKVPHENNSSHFFCFIPFPPPFPPLSRPQPQGANERKSEMYYVRKPLYMKHGGGRKREEIGIDSLLVAFTVSS